MQNMFTSEHYAAAVIDSYRAEARRHDLLAQARSGQSRRLPGTALLSRIRTALDSNKAASPMAPACQPGMAC